ncbi:hypothetical protein [Methanococcus aeolicus]|uniref:hypothetical protein n=1 Tax=Methanococcus aeolicus TaxID=42879 RepID=UPI0021C7F1FB|nr:hypothetical protein [Methanococcus aeolicus]UXM84820.1 hypothetical protein N6C89_00570 [Methanococcus aeolicus]
MDVIAIIAFVVMGLIIITAINAIGFKMSCGIFNKDVSYFEAIIILTSALINSIFYELIVLIPGALIVIYYSMSKYILLLKIIAGVVGSIGFFKSIKDGLEVGWIKAVVIYMVGNVINILILMGIVVILFIIGWWFGGAEHAAGNVISSQIPSDNIGTI